jgi:branched-chain amino acid transport system permease protein
MDDDVFTVNRFVNYGIGVTLNPPSFVTSNLMFFLFCLVIFCILGVIILNLKHSTTGLALSAIRWSERGSMTIGLSALQMKVIVAGLAAFIAGVGGGLLAAQASSAVPANFATLIGVVWLAVLVTTGTQSVTAALVAGVSLTLFTGVMVVYFPTSWGQVPTITFGIGAAIVAQNPEGYLAQNARYLGSFWRWLRNRPPVRHGDLADPAAESAGETRVLS